MNPKDLLDIDKMLELEKTTNQMKKLATKEEIKQIKVQDNFSDLQKIDQEKGIEDFGLEQKEENE